MIGSERSLLFFEDTLDLGHLKILLEKYEFNSNFVKDSKSFVERCGKKRYDLLIVSAMGTADKNLSLIDSLYITKNSDTPVLLIIDNNQVPAVDELLKQELNVITFPFTAEEFVYRAFRILKNLETEKNIHNRLASYRSLFDTLPVGVIQTDDHGKFLNINQMFQSVIDMEEQDIYKENFFQLCHPDDYFLERKQLDRLLRKELMCVDYEIRLINNEGKTLVCNIEASILWSGRDVFDSFIFVVRLIS